MEVDADHGVKVARVAGPGGASPTHQRTGKKMDVCKDILRILRQNGHPTIQEPGFAESLQAHFSSLPTRYALDVNIERAEDVLNHKVLLIQAQDPEKSPVFSVRAVHVLTSESSDPVARQMDDEVSSRSPSKFNVHPPAFGSTANLEALALDHFKATPMNVEDNDSSNHSQSQTYPHLPMHEVTFATIDKPKLLSQLSALLADVGLNIREAHVFSTTSGYSLDVFVVDGWPTEETEKLQAALQKALAETDKNSWKKPLPGSELPTRVATDLKADVGNNGVLPATSSNPDDWEIDSNQLKLTSKVANGSFGELFRGTYCGQDVAIKILKSERLTENLQREFQQEVSIMRKVRHKNVVQFIGACTKAPNLCIVTEFMSGGSVYDYLHKQKVTLKMSILLRLAIDVSKGMDYLHQNNIIHRDLKAANLLLDENEVVKVADFGVARVQAQSGIMTAETGTYRWMAPEVIEHKPYNRKADVFSFGIVLWELLTGKVPYADLTPLQAAVGVVQKGLRPSIPPHTVPKLAELLERCWQTDPAERPDFSTITRTLQEILKEVGDSGDGETRGKEKKLGGLFSHLKRSIH